MAALVDIASNLARGYKQFLRRIAFACTAFALLDALSYVRSGGPSLVSWMKYLLRPMANKVPVNNFQCLLERPRPFPPVISNTNSLHTLLLAT